MNRDEQGRRVREVWIEWAKRQPSPKPAWLVPYDELSEADKEADRCIGAAIWGDAVASMQGDMAESALQLAAAEARIAELEGVVERLSDLVRECRKHMRELDQGGHLEQSWPDFCADTARMIEAAKAEGGAS